MTGDARDPIPAAQSDQNTESPAAPAVEPVAPPVAAVPGPAPRSAGKQLRIELELARGRSAGWAAFYLILGILLISALGTVGVWVGIALTAAGAYYAWTLIQSFLFAAGAIVIGDREVTLPRGLSVPRPVTVPPGEVTAVYLLRRSVPFNRAAPVLIVEVGARALAYPRDWFASEADQRRIVHRLRELTQPKAAPAAGDAA